MVKCFPTTKILSVTLISDFDTSLTNSVLSFPSPILTSSLSLRDWGFLLTVSPKKKSPSETLGCIRDLLRLFVHSKKLFKNDIYVVRLRGQRNNLSLHV